MGDTDVFVKKTYPNSLVAGLLMPGDQGRGILPPRGSNGREREMIDDCDRSEGNKRMDDETGLLRFIDPSPWETCEMQQLDYTLRMQWLLLVYI